MADRMTGKPKAQKFLHGAAILTAGIILTKVLGALYKIPLNRIIGTEGFGHFNMAYSIFNVLLTISTAGLPIALSRMISEASAMGNRRGIQHIYHVSLRIFLAIGMVCSTLMLLLAPQLAALMRDPDAVYSIAALAPSVLLLCLAASLRGYFQGQQYMTPTAVSQILESLSKVVIGLAAVLLVRRLDFGIPQAAGAAILGVTAGSALSVVYLVLVYRKKRIRLSDADPELPLDSAGTTVKKLLSLAIPITIGAAGIPIINALDNIIIQSRLQDALGMTQAASTALFGTYSAAQTFYMLPPALIQPLAISIIPAVTAALTRSRPWDARRVEESAVRMTALIALPCGAGLAVLSSPIQALAYNYDPETLRVAGPLLAVLGAAVIFYCMVTVTNAILQAHGLVAVPIYNTLAGGAVNVILHYLLVGRFGIGGAAVSTVCGCAVIMFLNTFAMRRRLEQPPRVLIQFLRPMIAAALMSVVAYLVFEALTSVLGSLLIPTVVSVLAGCVVYIIMVLVLRIVTWDDCMLLPSGTKIARFLHITPEESEN